MPLAIVYPVLAQVLLTLVLAFATGWLRVSAVRSGGVSPREVALSSERWPERVRKVGNNLANQFETPVVFYVLCGVALLVGAAGTLMVILAWLYVASRLVHSYIHVTSNHLGHRFYAFAFGVCVLAAMWIVIVLHLLSA